jgi:hypothetical protein
VRFNRSEHRVPNGISAKCAGPRVELPHTRGSPARPSVSTGPRPVFLAPSPHTQPAAATITTHVSPVLGRAAIGAGNLYPRAAQALRRMLTAGTARLSPVTVRLPANASTVLLQGTAGGVQTATSIVISVGEW